MNTEVQKRIEDFIEDRSFYKIYSRNSSVYTVEVFGHASKKYLEELYGVTWSELAINTNEFCAVYGLGNELDVMSKKIVERINHSDSIKDFYENLALPDYEAYILLTDQLRQKYTHNTRIDFAELKKDFNDFHEAFYKLIAQCYIIFISDDPLTRELETALQSSFPDDTQQEISIKKQVVSVPLRKTAVVKERINFLQLKLAENNPDFLDLLESHAEQYNWFPVYNASDDAYTANHYREELRKLTVESVQSELARILKEQTEHEQQYALFLETITDKHLRKVVSLVNEFSYYREHRNDIRRKGLRNA